MKRRPEDDRAGSRLRTVARRAAGILGPPIALFFALSLIFPLPRERLDPPASTRILDASSTTRRMYVSSEDVHRLPVSLDEISPHLVAATVAFEDRWFRFHPGLNPVATVRALVMNLRAGRIVSGGSTITQQVARLIENRPRTLGAKMIEAFRALQLELRFSKRRILEYYLNLAPYGGNIQGVEAAALLYYGKPASELGPGEAALLAVLPNSPTSLRPDRNPEGARQRRDELLRRMLRIGRLDEEQFRLAGETPVPDQRHTLPFGTPHLGDMLRERHGSDAGDLTTTIVPATQHLAEELLERHLRNLRPHGITNGAVVVIENATRSVTALVGSAGYFNRSIDGQVNGAAAPRSPGSTLKPFAYALALDAGQISPSTLLPDIPITIAGYTPQNYDGGYRGAVTATEALVHSMNVPAVNVVLDLGADRFHAFLQRGGLSTLSQPWEHYGLSLVLGGVGVNLLDLTNLYATLARGGVWQPARLLTSDPLPEGRAILSPGAAYIITDILSQLRRPDFPAAWEFSVNLPRLAWKTGTSYGHRDAWSVGYNPAFTIGVWLGNFSGQGSPALIGADAAAPLLFDLATALEPDAGSWFAPPAGVDRREVCSVSGHPPGEACTSTRSELYLRDISPHEECGMHITLAIDDSTGERLCPHCRAGHDWHRETFVLWPPRLATWMRENGYPVPILPPHNPHCRTVAMGSEPVITSPTPGLRYVLRQGVPLEDQQIRLEAAVASDVNRLYWFVDGDLLLSTSPTAAAFLPPATGRHEIVCMDNEGRTGRLTLTVEGPGSP